MLTFLVCGKTQCLALCVCVSVSVSDLSCVSKSVFFFSLLFSPLSLKSKITVECWMLLLAALYQFAAPPVNLF